MPLIPTSPGREETSVSPKQAGVVRNVLVLLPAQGARHLARGYREKTFTRFPAGSRKIIDRLPQGWVVVGSTQLTPSAATRGYSASTSSAWKSRMVSAGRGCPEPAARAPSSGDSRNRH